MIGQYFWELDKLLNQKLPPKPRQKLLCPICGSSFIYFKGCYLHKRYGQPRLDIYVKCSECAHFMSFGVHITEEQYNKLKKFFRRGIEFDYNDTGHFLISPYYKKIR